MKTRIVKATETTPFSFPYLSYTLAIEVPPEREKEFEDIFPHVLPEYNFLKLRAVKSPINPLELGFIKDDPYPYRDLPSEYEERTLNELFLVFNALQPATIVLTGGKVKIEIGLGEREGVFFLEHPDTDLHRKAVEEFLINAEEELKLLLE